MRPILRISRRQFVRNIEAVTARIAPSELMLVMKDDAYGHGVEWAAGVAAAVGVGWFGSYDIATGLRVRATLGARSDGTEARVFAWATSTADEAAAALSADVDLGVGSADYLALVIAAAAETGRTARVHLKIDTGLHRNGIRPEDWDAVVADARAAEQDGLIRIVGLWSHLAEASDAEDDESQRIFMDALERLRAAGATPDALHLTASAASWWRPELRGSISRVGAFCYGIRSADGPDLPGVLPIAALDAHVIEVTREHAVIGIGAFDGLPSTLAGAEVATPGGLRELRRIDETQSVVSVWPTAEVGDIVRIFGPGHHGEQSATSLAERIDTVGEEVMTRLTTRVRRVIED